jgi:hypothetical protein
MGVIKAAARFVLMAYLVSSKLKGRGAKGGDDLASARPRSLTSLPTGSIQIQGLPSHLLNHIS